jgi:hypothetical protein
MLTNTRLALVALGIAFLAGCTQASNDKQRIAELEAKLDAVQKQVDRTEQVAEGRAAAPLVPAEPEQPLPVQKPPARPAAGTINVRVNEPWGGEPGLWLYVDRKLVKSALTPGFGISTSFEVTPGKHTVEVAGAAPFESGFALDFAAQQVEVAPGQTASLDLKLGNRAPAGAIGQSGIEDLSDETLRKWQDIARRQMLFYESDSLVLELQRQKELRPKRAVIWLEIPEKHGGPRDVDATQVRRIVGWIKWDTWREWPPGGVGIDIRLESDLTPGERAVKRALQDLQKVVKKHQDEIGELYGLARSMEEGG